MKLSFEARPGKSYTIQARETLDAGEWETLREVSEVTGTIEVEDASGARAARYYRLALPAGR
jgi:hypothetical protein